MENGATGDPIGPALPGEFADILAVINAGAEAYRGKIPAEFDKHPYMTKEQLEADRAAGVKFWCYRKDGAILGVMGRQPIEHVWLIRHAYVRPEAQRQGIASALLERVLKTASKPAMVGTWSGATWAISFYEKHGFRLVPPQQQVALLKNYWKVSDRQRQGSVVLQLT